MNKLTLVSVALLSAWVNFDTPAQAQQTSREQRQAAQRALRDVERAERFSVAAERCREAIDARQPNQASAWCATATREAVEGRRRGRRAFTSAETDLLIDAAWLVSVKGVQSAPSNYSRPPLNNVVFNDDAIEMRILAYQLLGDVRCRCVPQESLPALLLATGVPLAKHETLGAARRQALTALLEQPHTPERLWAIAALGQTVGLERTDQIDPERMQAEAAEMALRIEPLISEAHELGGRDAAVAPMLAYAHGMALHRAEQFSEALATFEAGASLCEQRLWPMAGLCLDMGRQTAEERYLIADRDAHPERANLTMPRPIGQPRAPTYAYEEPCTALLVGDIDDLGALTNIRIEYARPANRCRSYAAQYAAGLRYAPIANANPNQRRSDVLVRITVYPQ